jgi:hypothetical protein
VCVRNADPVGDYVAINQELALFSEDLAKKPQVRTTKDRSFFLQPRMQNAPHYSYSASLKCVMACCVLITAYDCFLGVLILTVTDDCAFPLSTAVIAVRMCTQPLYDVYAHSTLCMHVRFDAQVVVLNKIDLPEVAAIKDELLARIKERADHTRYMIFQRLL